MKEYLWLSIAVLAGLWILDAVLETRVFGSRTVYYALGLLFVMTIAFDQVVIASGLVVYDDAFNSGIRLAYMPVEDLAFGANLYLATMMSWRFFGRSKGVANEAK